MQDDTNVQAIGNEPAFNFFGLNRATRRQSFDEIVQPRTKTPKQKEQRLRQKAARKRNRSAYRG